MAFFPQTYSRIDRLCSNAGERLVLNQLRRCLTDDYTVWHDLPVGPLQRQPDFVIFNPRRGILVLEVKHWSLANIQGADTQFVRLLLPKGLVSCRHPLKQARECAQQINNVLEKDPWLRQSSGKYVGKCAVPYGYAAVMSNIRAKQVDARGREGFDEVFLPSHTLLRDELDEDVPPEVFQERLWSLFNAFFPAALSLPQQARVLWHIFPDLRVNQPTAAQKAKAKRTGKLAIPDLVQVMDRQQEEVARSLGDGHRVIHGAAGAGKTMILLFRAHELARQAAPGTPPALVLCFNKPLAGRIEQMLRERDIAPERVQVNTFHGWCNEMVRSYQLQEPRRVAGQDYFAALADVVERALHQKQIPAGQYSALLIDEAHDFQLSWLRIAVQLVDPETKSLLVLYDDAQSIYQSGRGKINLSKAGIEARGRTRILRVNYRNTLEILTLAMECAGQLLQEIEESDDQVRRVRPDSAGRRGPMPQLLRFSRAADEAKALAERIADLVQAGTSPDDIAVLCGRNNYWGMLEKQLDRLGIAHQKREEGRAVINWRQPSVKLLTMQVSKGLEFAHVFLMRIELMPQHLIGNLDEQLRLLYVAMTRATHALTMTSMGDTPLVQRVQGALQVLAESESQVFLTGAPSDALLASQRQASKHG